MEIKQLKNALDAILLTAEKPLPIDKLALYFRPEDVVNRNDIKTALDSLEEATQDRGFELVKVATGYRYKTREAYKQWVSQHWEEKPKQYSRALLETLALIVYRQPITRAEIEEIRGVAVSSHIVKTLQEREWVRIVGHKEVPGRPSMLGTTRQFLDYFNLKTLNDMPPLADIQDIDKLYPELDLITSKESDQSQDVDNEQGVGIKNQPIEKQDTPSQQEQTGSEH